MTCDLWRAILIVNLQCWQYKTNSTLKESCQTLLEVTDGLKVLRSHRWIIMNHNYMTNSINRCFSLPFSIIYIKGIFFFFLDTVVSWLLKWLKCSLQRKLLLFQSNCTFPLQPIGSTLVSKKCHISLFYRLKQDYYQMIMQ